MRTRHSGIPAWSGRLGPALVSLNVSLAILACTDDPAIGAGTTNTSAETTGTTSESPTTGEAPTDTGGGGSSTTAAELECVCHADCEPGWWCDVGVCWFDPNDCGEAFIEIPIAAPNVVLLLDKSGSMGETPWDGDGDPNTPDVTRWSGLFHAVEQFGVAHDRSMNLGAVLFPSADGTADYTIAACPVSASPEVPVAPMNAAALLAGLPPAEDPQIAGATPTRAALHTAIDHLSGLADGRARANVLVTDGAANCSLEAIDEATRFEAHDDAVVQVVADAAALGIPTFVVGLAVDDTTSEIVPDGEPDATNLFDRLNELAIAGGVPRDDPEQRFHGAHDQPGLVAALTAIAGALLPCVVQFDPLPKYPDDIDISVGGIDYGPAQAGACTDAGGWRHVDIEAGTFELCGQACADFRLNGSLTANYRCPSLIPPDPPQCE